MKKRKPVYNPVSGEPTRVKQEFKNDVDINEIVARMRRGIQPPPWMTQNTPRYGDFSDMPTSFQDAYAIVEAADAAFKSLPLEFRRAIDHDPRKLDRAPRELYEQFGLLKQKNSAGASPDPVRDHGSPTKADDGDRRDRPSKSPAGSKNTPQKGDQNTDD